MTPATCDLLHAFGVRVAAFHCLLILSQAGRVVVKDAVLANYGAVASHGEVASKRDGASAVDGGLKLAPHPPAQRPPSEWFLTESEITATRGGFARSRISPWSGDNSIIPLMNGDHFMLRLHEVISGAKSGDFVHGTAYELDPNVLLIPDPLNKVASDASSLSNVIALSVSRNVTVRILLSSNALTVDGVFKTCDALNKICRYRCCSPDNRHSTPLWGTHHEKIWVVRRQSRLIAIIGDLDVASPRWDTSRHDIADPRWQLQPKDLVRRFGWHGAMYEIEGGAAEDVEVTFWERWNSDQAPFPGLEPLQKYSLWLPSQDREHVRPASPKPLWKNLSGKFAAWWNPRAASHERPSEIDGTTGELVQVVRTFGCKSLRTKADVKGLRVAESWNMLGALRGLSNKEQKWRDPKHYAEFAPRGEYTYAGAWHKALRQAKKFIYVADQFMNYDEAIAAVIEAASHVEFVILVTNRQLINVPRYREVFQQYQYEALIEPLRKKDPSGKLREKFHIFSLHQPGKVIDAKDPTTTIWNHEKTLLIDDEFALVGSTGIERVGFTNDDELSISVAPKPGARGPSFAKRLRKTIFAEFLNLPLDDATLDDPDESLKAWIQQADQGNLTVRHYEPEGDDVAKSLLNRKLAGVGEAVVRLDGRCQDDAGQKQWEAARDAGSFGFESKYSELIFDDEARIEEDILAGAGRTLVPSETEAAAQQREATTKDIGASKSWMDALYARLGLES